MLRRILIHWFVIAVAIAITASLIDSVEIDGGFFALLGVSALFGLVNAILGPIARLLSLPLTLMTFGLFSLVINGLLLMLTAGLSDSLDVGGFFATIAAALLISLLETLLHFLIREPK